MRNAIVVTIISLLVTSGIDAQQPTAFPNKKVSTAGKSAAAHLSADTDLRRRAAAFMNEVHRSQDFSGVVLIARDGKILFSKPYGMASLELDAPNTPETKFRLASITKQFTAAAILLLQERGKLKVTDPICNFLRDCPPSWKTITVHQLLSHSSGIYSFTEGPDNDQFDPLPISAADMIARFRDKPLDFPPGEQFHYSDSGYLLLGAIVEQASGKKYEDFLRENIYEPLQMRNSGYDHPWIILKNRAQGYAVQDGAIVNAKFMRMDTPFGGGSQYSTLGDLLLWDQALYGDKLLSRESLTAMFTPNSARVPPEWLVGEKGGYGYGWMIEELFGRKLFVHGGLINGFSSIIMRYPEDHTLVVVLRNQEEDFPGSLKDLKIVFIGRGLSEIAFGLEAPAVSQ